MNDIQSTLLCCIFWETTFWAASSLLLCCICHKSHLWFFYPGLNRKTSLVAQMVKNLPAVQETQVKSLGQEDPLKKGMSTESNILAWEYHWQRSLAGYNAWGYRELDTTKWLTHTSVRQGCYTGPGGHIMILKKQFIVHKELKSNSKFYLISQKMLKGIQFISYSNTSSSYHTLICPLQSSQTIPFPHSSEILILLSHNVIEPLFSKPTQVVPHKGQTNPKK